MNITQERIREICKSFVSGMNAEQIAAVEGLSDAAVELLLADHAKECCEIQAYLDEMGWTLERPAAAQKESTACTYSSSVWWESLASKLCSETLTR